MSRIILIAVMFAFGAVAQAADPAAGKEGGVGLEAMQDFPRLAGQYNDYIIRALKDYQAGNRKNPIMGAQAKALSATDILDLAAYFSSQQTLVGKK